MTRMEPWLLCQIRLGEPQQWHGTRSGGLHLILTQPTIGLNSLTMLIAILSKLKMHLTGSRNMPTKLEGVPGNYILSRTQEITRQPSNTTSLVGPLALRTP